MVLTRMNKIMLRLGAISLAYAFLFILACHSVSDVPVPAKDSAAQSPEAVMQQFLSTNPKYRLPTREDVAGNPGFANRDDPRYGISDTNRDSFPDLVVVLVREKRFNVAVFHGSPRGFSATPVWIVRDAGEIIGGVFLENAMIIPLYCDTCDANPVYRWTGSEYDLNVHLSGESVCVESGAPLYQSPDLTSAIIRHTAKIAEVVVIEIGSRHDDYRWYKVRLVNEDGTEGFIQNSHFLDHPGICG
jgi:hypothetical protein